MLDAIVLDLDNVEIAVHAEVDVKVDAIVDLDADVALDAELDIFDPALVVASV